MEFRLITVDHPIISKRKITLILQDDDIHLAAAKFLVKEAKDGGRHGRVGGRTSHLQRAKQLRELFIHLHGIGLTWNEAIEVHIRAIRNEMLHWDENNNPNKKIYSYKKIKNDTMNTKLGVWFKFYKYMEEIGETFNMVLTTKKVPNYVYVPGMLEHLNQRKIEKTFIEVWRLRVPPSPKLKWFKAITRREFEYLCKGLRQKDIVYEMITRLMSDTGLRVEAALETTPAQFRSYFRYLNAGKSLESRVDFQYVAKGDLQKECKITIRMIADLQKQYLASTYTKRLKAYSDRCQKLGEVYNPNTMWILPDGRPVNYSDVYKAIRGASEKIGRIERPISAHWIRHSFATWSLLKFKDRRGLRLNASAPDLEFMLHLSDELGHADWKTTLRYVWTALQIEELERLELVRKPEKVYDGPLMTYQLYREDPVAQQIVKEIAIEEFGNKFKENQFDPLEYALKRRIAIDTSY